MLILPQDRENPEMKQSAGHHHSVNLSEYQKLSRQTAIYPDMGLLYPVLGLAGEAGELLDKDQDGSSLEAFGGELGDVLWYISQTATEANMKLEDIAQESTIFGKNTSDSCVHLVVCVARVSECVKKMLRDDGGVLTTERHKQLYMLLKDVLSSWLGVAQNVGLDPADVAASNINKLFSRRERGVLKGSGDDR